MRHMVVELKIVVYDSVIDMIELKEVLQRPCPLFMRHFDIVDFNGRNGNWWPVVRCFKNLWQTEW